MLLAAGLRANPAPEPAEASGAGWSWEGTVALEAADVLQGGLERGVAGRTLMYLGTAVDSGMLGLPSGGRMHLVGALIGHRGPVDAVGDAQGASNIAAPDAARLYEWWGDWDFGASGVTASAGLMDLNRSFVVTEDGANLLNSSFGITPTISGNVPTPIFPEPGLGAEVAVVRGRWTTRAGLFQGDPSRRFSPWNNGSLAIAETRCAMAGGSCTFGVWRHTAAGTAGPGRHGFYLLVQHALGTPRLNGFIQLSGTAGAAAGIPRYLGAGFDLAGPLAGRPDDHLVVGMASAAIRGTRVETSYELGYVARVTGRLNLQPDLQYIVHPGGTGAPTWLAMVRATLTLN